MNEVTAVPARIYLDNAATSWPKPEAVYRSVDDFNRRLGSPAGRSTYAEAVEVSRRVDAVRSDVAALLGAAHAAQVIFVSNGTDALNLVLHGLLSAGDHVVTTVTEHNSVLRPLRTLQDAGLIQVTHVDCDDAGRVEPAHVRAALRPNTRLIAINHASNVTGAIQPVADIAEIARRAGVLSLCDAAQTAGHLDASLPTLGVDFVATPGHKGLLGPLGTGIVAMRPDAAACLRTVRQGGTGTRSEDTRQPEELPDKFESGNLNVPGILGLGAGLQYLREQGLPGLAEAGTAMIARLCEGLRGVDGVTVWGPTDPTRRVPLVSITLPGYDPQEAGLVLDGAYRIQVRAGLHCAPAMHRRMGTVEQGGTLRFSLGPFTTSDEIETAIRAVGELAAGAL